MYNQSGTLGIPQAQVNEPTRLNGDLALDYQHYHGFTPVQPPAAPVLPSIPRPQNISFNEWGTNQKELYFRLEDEARSFAGSHAKLVEQTDVVEHFSRIKDHSSKELQKMQAAEKEIVKKMEKSKGSLKRKLAPGSYKKKLAERERTLSEIRKGLAMTQQSVQEADRQLQPSLNEKQRLEAAARREVEIRAQQEAILNSLFEGMAGDDNENAAENSVRVFVQLAVQIEQALADQRAALQYISKAVECIEKMLKLMRSAQTSNTIDMFSDGLIGFVAGMNTNAKMNEASQLGQEAQRLVKKAHQYSPYMPSAKKAQAGWGPLLSFTNLLFDNIFMDIMQGAMIAQQTEKLREAYQDAAYSMQWQSMFVQNISRDRDQNARNLQAAREKLLYERIRLINTLGR